ncbi:CRISPR-associated endonuclease Cas2 [Sinosporangium album]|uniref:CRISPR-associated endonuclease Cas2 n=1 Tax=Sinosporangium album TaxID=504805 RepID=UPI001FE0BB7F|nr:CRISPR-associated endonuclease Cas2 [Sinosporangium album]
MVYDTLAKRNAQILRLCRQYLHHVQRSVFEGPLSAAQLRRFQHKVESVIDPGYDSVLVFTFPRAQPLSATNGASDSPPPATSSEARDPDGRRVKVAADLRGDLRRQRSAAQRVENSGDPFEQGLYPGVLITPGGDKYPLTQPAGNTITA